MKEKILKEKRVLKIMSIVEIICSVIAMLLAINDFDFFFCGLLPVIFVVCFMEKYKPVFGFIVIVMYAIGNWYVLLGASPVPWILMLVAFICSVWAVYVALKRWQRERKEDPEQKIFRLYEPEEGTVRSESEENRLRAFGWLRDTAWMKKRSYADWKSFLMSRSYQGVRFDRGFQQKLCEVLNRVQIDMGVEKILIEEVETLRTIRPLSDDNSIYDFLEESIHQAREKRNNEVMKSRKNNKLVWALIIASGIAGVGLLIFYIGYGLLLKMG